MSLKYRPEIDGLRSLAVLAVVLFHAEFFVKGKNLFSGGFLGVDVFFVISGYLITLIILKELGTGQFNFANFYMRRVRRILPLLFTVFSVCTPIAFFLLEPKPLKEYSSSLLSSLLFSSNIWFMGHTDYWDTPAHEQPLLHTWSLSVEEQFYMFIPLGIFIFWKKGFRSVFSFFIGVFFISLVATQIMSSREPDWTFYLMPFRAWELAVGALVAGLHFKGWKVKWTGFGGIALLAGLLAMIAPVFLFTEDTTHPSLWTLIPVAGTGLCLFVQDAGKYKIGQILSSRLFVVVGLLSYGLYLWHFPVFAFAYNFWNKPIAVVKVALIALSFVLSFMTYHWVENPLRKSDSSLVKPYLVGTLALLLSSNLFFVFSNGAEFRIDRFTNVVDRYYWSKEENQKKFWTHEGCWAENSRKRFTQYPFLKCKKSESLKKKNLIMLIGDSNAASLVPGLIKAFGKDHVVQRVLNSCLPALDFGSKICKKTLELVAKEAKELNPDIIRACSEIFTKRRLYCVSQLARV